MATTGTKVPAIKNIPPKTDPELKATLESMKEAQEIRLGRRGDPRDRNVTLRELIDSGLAKQLRENPFDPNAGTGTLDFTANTPLENLAVPPAPVSLEASGVFTAVILNWNGMSASAPYGNHAYTEIWRSRANNLGGATLRATTTAFIYTDEVGYGETYYYWVRYVSTSNVPGPYNATNGTPATTAEDVATVMAALSETLQDLPGYSTLEALISGSAGTAATVIRSNSQPTTRDNGDALVGNDIWIDTDDNNQAYFRNAANSAWIAARDSNLISLYNSLSSTVSTNTSNISTAQSDIVTLTSDTTANASAISSLTSTVNSNTSAIASEATTRANADSALSTSISNLTSTVNGNSSSITTLQSTTSDINGDLNAMYVLQVTTESNSSISAAGMVLGSNANTGSGAQSYIQFHADDFVIWNDLNSSTAPFIVSGNTVYIKDAMIQDAAITTAKIQNLAVETAKIGNLQVTEGKLADLAVTNAKIANATITDAKIANLSANKINTGSLSADYINIDNVTLDTNGSGTLIIKSAGVGTLQIGLNAVSLFAIATGNAGNWYVDNLSETTIAETSVFQAPTNTDNPFAVIGNTMVLCNSGTSSDFVRLRLYRRSASTSAGVSGATYSLIQNYTMYGDSGEAIQTILESDVYTSDYYYQYKMTLQTQGTSTIGGFTRTYGPSILQVYVTFR